MKVVLDSSVGFKWLVPELHSDKALRLRDDYLTGVKVHHYREIACFVQGRTTASVVVAAALESNWTRAAPLLERAVEAYRVS